MAVNLSPLGGAGAQFFTNDGVPLTGGLLYTYLAGTTTPATTYTSGSGAVALPNPIILDAAGRVPTGEIWLSDGINYKFVLKDSTDALIATWDGLSGINSNFIAYTSQEETATATAGQTVFNLTLNYITATNNLAVFVNGSNQIVNVNYLETDSNTVTFLTGLNVGDVVKFSTATPVATNVTNAANVQYTPAGTGAVTTNVQAKLREWVSVTDFIPAGTDTAATDCSPYFQAAIDYCMKQYDPSETTMDGNDFTYIAQQKTLWVPIGRYRLDTTLNMSFRNQIEIVGENEWNSILWWQGAIDGMVIDARCSSYVTMRNFTIDGGFKAITFIYCAGNGVNAVGSKGNVTGNYFGHIMFWNQKGNLTPPYVDYQDQYNPLTAMLNTITIEPVDTFFNSMDDSVIEFCRFAPNSLNNFYAIGISSSANTITECAFFSANGVLCYNGAQFWMSDCVGSMYAPSVQDSLHNHALIKFNYNAGLGSISRGIELHHCYLEGQDYYGNSHSVKLAYWAQGNVVSPEDEGVMTLLVNGGTYGGTSVAGANFTYIDIQANRRANIQLINTTLQGPAKLYIYAPDSSVAIEDHTFALTGYPLDTQTWQIIDVNSVTHKYQTPEFQVEGAVVPDVSVYVGTTDLPGQLKFLSLDEALQFVSNTKGNVTIYLDQNDTVSIGGTINSNVGIALNGFTLTVNAFIFNKGALTISNTFVNNTRGGTVISSAKNIINTGQLTVKNCSLNNAVINGNGTILFANVDFVGTASNVLNNEAGRIVIDSDTCTFTGTGYIVDLGSKYGDVNVKSATNVLPTTGLWMKGTKAEFSSPSTGAPNQYWATANGIGAAANWAHSGNLT